MGIPPERRAVLKILPPELIEALRQPLPYEQRRALINSLIADQLTRLQALRYVEELRRAGHDEPAASLPDDDAPPSGITPDR